MREWSFKAEKTSSCGLRTRGGIIFGHRTFSKSPKSEQFNAPPSREIPRFYHEKEAVFEPRDDDSTMRRHWIFLCFLQ